MLRDVSMGPHGKLHEKHVRLIKKPIRSVLDGMPATTHPHNGDVEVIFMHLFSVMKDVFCIPTSSAGVDAEYLAHLMKYPLKADFVEFVMNAELLD